MPNPTGLATLVYTDGSCPKPGGPGGWAYVVVNGDAAEREDAGHFLETTHQIAELTAALKALEGLPAGSTIKIVSDSKYVVRGCDEWMPAWKELGWRKTTRGEIANLGLWQSLDLAKARHVEVECEWVRGHSGVRWNEYVDQKAGEQTLIAKSIVTGRRDASR